MKLYTYLITGNSYSSTTVTDSVLCPGTYTASVTDIGQGVTCDLVFEILALTSNSYTINIIHPTTSNPCNGYAEIIVTGGVPPYSYQWYDIDTIPIPGETEFFMDSVCNGTYYVQFWDNTPPCGMGTGPGTGGCGSAGSGLIQVAVYDPIVLVITNIWAESCPGNCDAGFCFSVSGGSGNYTFNWPLELWDAGTSSGCSGPDCAIDGLYQVWDDVGGYDSEYLSTANFFPEVFPELLSNETCYGACDGSIQFNCIYPSTYEYSIDGGATWQFSNIFNNLCADTYDCYIAYGSWSVTPCVIDMGSIVVTQGTILPNTGTDVQEACSPYIWIDGNTYTSSTSTPTWTLTNQAGCDSVVTLNLTILNNGSDTFAIACDSFEWFGTTYIASGTFTHTFTNIYGCDSVVTLHLTIQNSDNTVDIVSACDAYTWIDGNTYTSSTNTPTWTLTNQAGCDSTITLNLTVYQSPYIEIAGDTVACESTQLNAGDISTGNQYLWSTGDTTHAVFVDSSGYYTLIVTDIHGCSGIDSIFVTLDSTPVVDLGPDTSICGGDQIILDGGTGSYYTYMWSTGQTIQSITVDSSGIGYGSEEFWVEVVNGTCYNSDTIIITFVNCTGFDELSIDKSTIKTYPNPTTGKFSIIADGFRKAEILNSLGQRLLISNKKDIDIINFASGVYYVKIITDKGAITGKIFKK
ncbi:MAG: hypothetical protein Kow0068_14760 [Marinilabiliales bacterium]